jgi:hypothetical protein
MLPDAPATIFDDHGRAEPLLQPVLHEPRDHVG